MQNYRFCSAQPLWRPDLVDVDQHRTGPAKNDKRLFKDCPRIGLTADRAAQHADTNAVDAACQRRNIVGLALVSVHRGRVGGVAPRDRVQHRCRIAYRACHWARRIL